MKASDEEFGWTGSAAAHQQQRIRPLVNPPQSYRVAIGGFVWACTGFVMLLYFNVVMLRRTLDEFDVTGIDADSGASKRG